MIEMKIFGFNITKREAPSAPYLATVGSLDFGQYTDTYTESKATKIAAVYRAINVIADSVAVMPINIYKYDGNWKKKQYDNLYYLLNVQPNKLMNAYQLKRLIITHLKLKGNAYIWIDRNIKNEIKNLYVIHPDRVKISVNKDNLTVEYYIDNQKVSNDNLIHLINYSEDGIIGKSTLDYARSILQTAHYTNQHQLNFFENGANVNGILKPKDGVFLNKTQAQEAKQAFLEQTQPSVGAKTGGIVVLGSDLDFQQISISPRDAQLIETKEFTLLDIAQFFGVPLSKLFFTKNNKYNTVEAEQLDFLTSTIQPLVEMIEIELFRKLILPSEWGNYEIKFDTTNLLRLDAQTQADVYVKLLNIGALTPNEIREKLDADYPVTGGNRAFVQQNLQPLDNLMNDIKNTKTE